MKKNNFKFISPIWLMSSERSGSNLIVQILDNHSKICGPVIAYLIRFFDKISSSSLTITKKKLLINKLFDNKIGSWKLKNLKKINFSNNIFDYIYHIFLEEMKLNKKQFLFIKENKLSKQYKIIKKISKNPRFIFLIRDPRDMALSWKKIPNLRGGIFRATNEWVNDQKDFFKFKKKLKKDKFIDIRYEDLTQNKTATLKKICKFLNINFEKKITNFFENNETQEISKSQPGWNNLSKSIFKNSNKYLKELNNNEIAYIEYRTSKLLKKYRYKIYNRKLDQKKFRIIEKEMILKNNKLMKKKEYLKLSKKQRTSFERLSKTINMISNLN